MKGFTLMELLVIILIIGVLTAVALPQYQKAVAKSRFTQIVTAARSLYDAQQVYYMANGSYAQTLDELDVTFSARNSSRLGTVYFGHGHCSIGGRIGCEGNIGVGHFTWQIFFPEGSRWCCAYADDDYAASSLCASEIGKGRKDWFNGCGGEGGCHCWAD